MPVSLNDPLFHTVADTSEPAALEHMAHIAAEHPVTRLGRAISYVNRRPWLLGAVVALIVIGFHELLFVSDWMSALIVACTLVGVPFYGAEKSARCPVVWKYNDPDVRPIMDDALREFLALHPEASITCDSLYRENQLDKTPLATALWLTVPTVNGTARRSLGVIELN